MLPTDDVCDCLSMGLVDVGIPGRFVQLYDCLHCGAPVTFDSCSLPDSASEMEPPKDPRVDAAAPVGCIVHGCDFGGTVEQLWKHALDRHLQHVLMEENPWRPVMLPYDVAWMNDTKRFLLHSPFGIYVISLELCYDPAVVMVSVEGLDGHWRDFEVLFHIDSLVWTGSVRARTFSGHLNETVFHQLDTYNRSLEESLPQVYIKVSLENPPAADQTDSESHDGPSTAECS